MIELTSKSAEWMQFPYLRITISGHLDLGRLHCIKLIFGRFSLHSLGLEMDDFFFFFKKKVQKLEHNSCDRTLLLKDAGYILKMYITHFYRCMGRELTGELS